MQLKWAILALADREDIFNYIERDSPQAAIVVDDRIEQQVGVLEQFPEMGVWTALSKRGSWSFSAHLISRFMASTAMRSVSCAYCMGRSNGLRIFQKW
jgi:plasmid stabilization system protein ParE